MATFLMAKRSQPLMGFPSNQPVATFLMAQTAASSHRFPEEPRSMATFLMA